MLTWIVAAAAGVAAAALSYGLSSRSAAGTVIPLALLRGLAFTLLFALLFDATFGAARVLPPLVALDASLSWQRGADRMAWNQAVLRARSPGGEPPLIFGDSVRAGEPPPAPADGASRVQGAVERAIGTGRRLVVVTDGELDDPDALAGAPAGSSIEIVRPDRGPDAAVISIDAPRFAVAGDSIDVRVSIRAGETAPSGVVLGILIGESRVGEVALNTLQPRSERTEFLRARVPGREGPGLLWAVLTSPARGDAEPRNDSAAVALDVTRAAGAVLISTAPDLDVRYIVPVLRGAVAIPTEAYLRVAPGNWRREGTLAAVPERDVRDALARAPIAILHGDTAYFGAPRSVASGALALLPAVAPAEGEWYAVAAPPSPLSAMLSGTPWDSLPPLFAGEAAPAIGWEGLTVARARRLDRRAAISGTDRGRRVAVVTASGTWRWRFRGGVAADAHAALWGGIFDWLAAERPDPRGAVPATGVIRAGEPVRWRRGASPDSVIIARLTSREGIAGPDSVVIRFAAGALTSETAPLPQGVWDAEVPGGRTVVAVSASRELLPARPSVAAGSIPGVAAVGERPRLRNAGWAYLLLVGALCAEWLLRRRRGLR
jgi:hypothetical protein